MRDPHGRHKMEKALATQWQPTDQGFNPPGPRFPVPDLPAPATTPAFAPPEVQADLRLVIEEDGESGSFIYKTVDHRTGEIVTQFPRDDVLKLHSQESYSAGHVIRTKA